MGGRCIAVVRNKPKRYRIEAMTFARRGGTVWEHMAEMAVTSSATDLDSHHAVACVANSPHMLGIERSGEAWPSGSRVELIGRSKERELTETAGKDAFAVLV